MTGFLRQIRVSDFGRVVTGGTPSTSDSEMWGEGYPFVTPTEMDGRGMFPNTGRVVTEKARSALRTKFCPAGSIAVCCIGATIGKVVVLPVDSLTNQQINSILVDETLHDSLFVYYLMRTQTARLRAVASGSATPILNKSFFESLSISVPTLPYQRAIAGMLGALDDKIESNRRQHSLIELTVEATFQNICANFSGKYQVMGNIVEQGVSGVWGSDTQQSESEVCITCLRGVDLHDLASGVIPTAPLRWISAGQSASRVPQEGEIWVEASGFRCGRSVVIGSHTNALFAKPVRNSNFVKRLVPKISVRDSYVAWLALKKVYSSEEINNFRTGTSIRNLDVEGMLKNVPVPILDDERFSQLEGLVTCMLSPSRAKETSSLESLRDTLLPELLSGRLRVKDAESMMENV